MSLNPPWDWSSLTISQQASKDFCSTPLNDNLRWTKKALKRDFFIQRISLQQFIAIQIWQWTTICRMVKRMGSHEEEGAKMIMNMVLVALCLKCLSLTYSGQTILKAYYLLTWLFLFVCEVVVGQTGWARFVTQTRAHFKEAFRERKARIIWHCVGTDHLQGWLCAEAEQTQAMGTQITEKAE